MPRSLRTAANCSSRREPRQAARRDRTGSPVREPEREEREPGPSVRAERRAERRGLRPTRVNEAGSIIPGVPVAHPLVPPAVRVLLAGAIDYAGLFPPAELTMPAAVAEYLSHRSGADAWALGRFVVPVARLPELEDALRRCAVHRAGRVPLAALIGTGTADDVDAIELFNRRTPEHGGRVGAVEVKAASEGAVRAVLAGIPRAWIRYIEVPVADGGGGALDAVAAGGAFAKIRTGGTSAEAFPPADRLATVLAGLARRSLPFKATAGLHHPLRGVYPLIDAPEAPRAEMYGYLNLALAAAVIQAGGDADEARAALLEADPGAVRLEGDALRWRDERFDAAALAALRDGFFHGFGSCSFRQPMDELLPAVG